MNGGQAIAQVLEKHNVRFLFTLIGGHISPIVVGVKQRGIRVIDVRNEATAVFAADAVSRLSGIPGIAAVTAGPGVTNTITAVKNAQMAQSPLILLGGAVATVLKGRGALQDIDQMSLFKPITKWAVSIKANCDIEPIFDKAFEIAQSGTPGPVFIECPIDILYDEALVREWYLGKTGVAAAKSLSDKVLKWYLSNHLEHMFACSIDDQEPPAIFTEQSNTPAQLSGRSESFDVDPKKIAHAITYINNASKPLLLIGSQALLNIDLIPKLIEALGTLGIPIYLSGMARGLMGANHPLQFRHARGSALKQADLVLLAGVPLDFRLNYGKAIRSNTPIVSINRDEHELKQNRKPDLGIHTDPAKFLVSLAEKKAKIEQKPELKDARKQWLVEMTTREDARDAEIAQMASTTGALVNPLALCQQIDRNMGENSLIIADGGDFVATASYILRPRRPLTWLDPGPYGTLGVGAGFALGAKLCRPEAEVWLIYGDGAAGYSLVEFDTFSRHQTPVIGVIGNDGAWAQIARDQVDILHDDVATVLTRNDYHTAAEGFGGKGLLLTRMENAKEILEQAKALASQGHSVLINAHIDKSDFRKGSISM
jgi:acetolactate synthase-1/2/3 large subunit